MNKAYGIQRILAYVIDLLLVTFISSLLLVPFDTSKANEDYYNQYNNLKTEFINKKISSKEYITKVSDVSYNIEYNDVFITITNVTIFILYFGVFQYLNKGQTLGKKLMKIKVIDSNNGTLTMNQVIIRSLFNTGILISIINLVVIIFLNSNYYLFINLPLQYLQILIYVVLLLMIFIKKDGRGFHDMLAKTNVISLKEVQE